MNKKKIFARICAMVAVALIVASLAIPAFADYQDNLPTPDADYKDGFRSYYLPDAMNTPQLTNLEFVMGDALFYCNTLIGGRLSAYYVPTLTSIGSVNSVGFTQSCAFTFSNSNFTVTDIGSIITDFTVDRFRITLTDSNESPVLTIQYYFTAIQGSTIGYLETIYDEVNMQVINPEYTQYLYIAYYNSADLSYFLNDMCFGNYVLHPADFYRGWLARQTNATDDAYDRGYQQGKIDGINSVGDGGLADQLIGGTLRAPFDAMRNFTLVEWTTQGGTTITITLAQIVSAGIGVALFVWFLKLFAGG